MGLFHYLIRHHIWLPVRPEWPAEGTVTLAAAVPLRLSVRYIHHPIYAGAYAYGRRPVTLRGVRPAPPTPPAVGPNGPMAVLIQDIFPASITWEHYLKNQERLNRINLALIPGARRRRRALLAGSWSVARGGAGCTCPSANPPAYYSCLRHFVRRPTDLSGGPTSVLDNVRGASGAGALEPAALELSLQARQDVER